MADVIGPDPRAAEPELDLEFGRALDVAGHHEVVPVLSHSHRQRSCAFEGTILSAADVFEPAGLEHKMHDLGLRQTGSMSYRQAVLTGVAAEERQFAGLLITELESEHFLVERDRFVEGANQEDSVPETSITGDELSAVGRYEPGDRVNVRAVEDFM